MRPLIAFLFLPTAGLLAVSRTSFNYAVPAEGMTAGGGSASSANYAQTTAFGLIVGTSAATSPATTVEMGLVAQYLPTLAGGGSAVSMLGLTKTRHFQQTAAATTSIANFSMSAFIEGTDLSGTFPTALNRFQPSAGSSTFLNFDSDAGSWGYQVFHSTQGGLDTAFPNGAYDFLVGGSPAVMLSFPSATYPVVPVVSATVGVWSGGRLLLTAAQAAAGLTLVSNVSTGDGYLTMEVFSDTADIIYEEITQNPGLDEFLTGTVPPGSLAMGQTYEVYTEFDEVVSSTLLAGQAWAQAGATGFALFSSNTRFEIRVITPLEAWRLQNFGTISSSGVTADTGDQDGDGVVNLLEWAVGLNPTQNSTLHTPAQVVGGIIEFTYTRSVEAVNAGATFTVEWSDTLGDGSWNTIGVTASILTDNGTMQQVKATLPAGSNGRRFVRLRVNAPL